MTSEEKLNCLTDRPCDVCKYHKENGCSKWSCVFEQEPTPKNDLGNEERELAITYLEEMKESYISGVGYERHPLPEYYALENAIKALDQEPRWIPVSERLPKANEFEDKVRKYYLVQNEFDDMLVAYYDGRYWSQIYTHSYIKDRIVAWMPLPPSYERGEEE